MKKKLLPVLLALLLLLGGCMSRPYVSYENMTYQRPDMTEIQEIYAQLSQTAAVETDPEAVINAVYAFYDAYDWFYTSYSLADLRYSSDLTDIYWEKEYSYCASLAPEMDALLENMYYLLADAPSREALEGEDYFGEGFFDSYEGDSGWDEGFSDLLARESELQSQYYALTEEALAYESGSAELYDALGREMGQVLVELIALRQEMAAYWGYEDYCQFANDFYYYRDYTPQQTEQLLADIQAQLVEPYRKLNATDVWAETQVPSSEKETLAFVRQAAKAMGGTAWEAFQRMERCGLYDIAYGENKYNTSFEVYLSSYRSPFVFVSPGLTRYDWLVLAHEFGHFCRDHAADGYYVGTDVLEVFSQSMEYLMLCYGEAGEDLTRLKLADSLCLYVEQAAYAAFEQQMYRLTGSDLSVEGLNALYARVAEAYGLGSVGYDAREYVQTPHFYTNPMYIISYVVSNDAAMQLYQLELGEAGAGLAALEKSIVTQEPYFLAFLEETELESPFAPGRMEQVKETFEKIFG